MEKPRDNSDVIQDKDMKENKYNKINTMEDLNLNNKEIEDSSEISSSIPNLDDKKKLDMSNSNKKKLELAKARVKVRKESYQKLEQKLINKMSRLILFMLQLKIKQKYVKSFSTIKNTFISSLNE
jgi:hypothetical protein